MSESVCACMHMCIRNVCMCTYIYGYNTIQNAHTTSMAFPDILATIGHLLNWILNAETVDSTCHKSMGNN